MNADDQAYINDFLKFLEEFRGDTNPVEHTPMAAVFKKMSGELADFEKLYLNQAERDIAIAIVCLVGENKGPHYAYGGGTNFYRDVLITEFGLERNEVKTHKPGDRVNGLNIAWAASEFGVHMQDWNRISWKMLLQHVSMNSAVQAFFN